jgi:triacylglycerol esterase/lipase EstA (alpha/beta hydrolase family)
MISKSLWLAKTNAGLLALVFVAGCASLSSTASSRLDRQIASADATYRRLDADRVTAYNTAVASIAREIDGETPDQLRTQLNSIHVKLEQPTIQLPLARYHIIRGSRMPDGSNAVGVPMLLEYDTSRAALYPREGLLTSATAVYRRVNGEPHLSLISAKTTIDLNGSTFALAHDDAAPITEMTRRGRHVAQAGFSGMIDPAKMPVKAGIFLTEPYDPNKIPVLMVHGLQSTPFAFANLINAIRRDPTLNEHFQVWTFLYGTGTPVVVNALHLRQELDKTIRELDSGDHDFATRHIVVLGHSMGGIMAHTLVSSSRERLWDALFTVPPNRLRGDKAMIGQWDEALHFKRNPRVVRAIFAATPHRGSSLAETWIGHIGQSLIHLPSGMQTSIVTVVSTNRDLATASAKAFDTGMNFSAVHTLSPKDPALHAIADLRIEMPFHSIIGQHNAGAIETSSDGVVPYASSHLDGAASELVVHSGHNICEKVDAQREVVRILRLELQRENAVARR